MSTEEETCCACGNAFVEGSQPRMMPACEHSACTGCLRTLLVKGSQKLTCKLCGHVETLTGVDLEYFPKNIGLTKLIRQRSIASKTVSQAEDSLLSANSQELCSVHGKELELVCLIDRQRLCAHCALFGSHKDHRFKTVGEAKELMVQTKQQFQSYRTRKVELDQRLNSSEFKEGVARKISAEKDRLVGEIKRRFEEISENVRMAEKKAYEELVKNFKTVYGKIIALIKEENDSQRRYKQWENKCAQLFQRGEKMSRVEEKIALYCGGPLEICSEGDALLSRLQAKINSNIATIEALISQIKVVENPGISNSVFNFISVIVQDNEPIEGLPFVQQETLSPRIFKEEKQQKIEFASSHLASPRDNLFARESVSPLAVRRKSKSKEKLAQSDKRPSKEFASPQRSNVSALIDEFCEKENLDTLDLTNYGLSDGEIYEVLAYLRPVKKVKGLKLVKNRLTNEGLGKIIDLIPNVTNINLSFNTLTDEAISTLLVNRSKISALRIINLSNNKINERKIKNAIDELKKQGVIVTL